MAEDSKLRYCQCSFFPPRVLEWEFHSDSPFPDRCLLLPFYNMWKNQVSLFPENLKWLSSQIAHK